TAIGGGEVFVPVGEQPPSLALVEGAVHAAVRRHEERRGGGGLRGVGVGGGGIAPVGGDGGEQLGLGFRQVRIAEGVVAQRLEVAGDVDPRRAGRGGVGDEVDALLRDGIRLV